ncbi:hypothetical protein [Floccifex sp.]|uniref:hypothetical protein n=1 Tax=Floccifex sp. TaxID=2815810 RepID=UPI003F123925
MKRKINIWLTYFIVFTMMSISVSFAKYSTESILESNARVAKYGISVNQDSNTSIKLDVGNTSQTGNYTFSVKNESEVILKYHVFLENVSNQIKVTLKIGEDSEEIISSGSTLYFSDHVLNFGQEQALELIFEALDGTNIGQNTIKINVHTEQID